MESADELNKYFKSIQMKYDQKANIEIKEEVIKVRQEIENKNVLIEKYKHKVKEWRSHFEPLYLEQNEILHSSGQVFSSGDIPFSPMPQTPLPNTPTILSSFSQRTPPSFSFHSL
eukprot:gene1492-1733_t